MTRNKLRQNYTALIRKLHLEQLVTAGASNALSNLVGIFCYFVQVPIALNYLGNEGFGFWMTLMMFLNLLQQLDFGIGNSFQNKIAEAIGNEQENEAIVLARTGLIASAALGATITTLILPLAAFIDWAELLKISSQELGSQANSAILIIILAAGGYIPAGFIPRAVLAFGRGWQFGIANSTISIATLIIVILASWLELAFIPFLIIVSLFPLLSRLIFVPQLCKPQYNFLPWLLPWRKSLSLIMLGGQFMTIQICALVLFTLPSIVVSSFLGAAALTPFNLCQRIFGILWQLQQIVLTPLRASISTALGRNHIRWITLAYRVSLFGSTTLAIAFVSPFLFFGPQIFLFWTKDSSSVPSSQLIFSFAAWTLVIAIANPVSCLLNGISKLSRMTFYGLLTCITATFLMIYLAPLHGPTGVVSALVIAYTTLALFPTLIDAELQLKKLHSRAS
jgi:O-antigen/teichoic acid export membrane protein